MLRTSFLQNGYLALFLLAISISLAACGQKSDTASRGAPSQAVQTMPASDMGRAKMFNEGAGEQSLTEVSEPTNSNIAATVKRFIAMRHSLVVETPASQMQAAFDATVAHCEALKCQILGANYNRETPYNPPSASLSLRVPPRSIEIFLSGLAKNSEVLQHRRDSEDKTDAVIDADARIKNLTQLRDKLRSMLNDKSAKFKDIIDVERELASTQAQLDSINGVRKALAQETELVAVNIDFTASQGISEQGFFASVVRALDDAGRVMMESVANVITFIISALPWLIFGIPVIILVRKFWTKIKAMLM